MVLSHENIKLSNKEEILNKINEKTNIPMSEEILKHNLVENGVSSYQFELQGSDAFKPIIETFKKLSDDEITKLMPKINSTLKAVSKNLYDN